MKPRTSLIAIFAVAIPAALLLLITTARGSSGTTPTATPPSFSTDGRAESTGRPVEEGARPAAATEATEPPVSSVEGGPILLQTYCSECHSVKLLERTRKSRAEWEMTLARMARYSDLLGETERLLALDYLAGPDKP